MLDEIQEGKMASNFFFIQVQFQRFNHEMENEQFDQACARMERMRDLDPANPVIFYNLGIVYTFLKLDDKALDAFTRCVQIEPGLHQAWYNMGQLCLLGKRDPSRALHCFDRVVSRDPSHISGHAQRATALELLGDKARAVESWRKVLELQPEHKEAQKNIERLTQAAV
jgi:tetratricopeptide (TPR) repeat protein